MKLSIIRHGALLATLACLAVPALAQDRHDHRERIMRGPMRFDARYHHDHYYPSVGFVTGVLPGGSIGIGFGGGHYYYSGGVWFRPYAGRFAVVVPPIGIVVPMLPPSYVTLWIGGAPYYYANGAYYAAATGQGYAVVAPPPGADGAQPAPAAPPAPPALPDPIYYPRNQQSAEQTEADRQACNRWATSQPQAMADASVFQRAVAACMDGRGYSVR